MHKAGILEENATTKIEVAPHKIEVDAKRNVAMDDL